MSCVTQQCHASEGTFHISAKTAVQNNMTRWLAAVALIGLILSMAFSWLPTSAAFEELSVVVMLLTLEVFWGRRWRTTKSSVKKAPPSPPASSRLPSTTTSTTIPLSPVGNLPQIPDEQSCTFTSEIQIAAKAGDIARAESLMHNMEKKGAQPTLVCYGALIGACAKIGDVQGAERWLENLIGAGLGKPNAICVNITISACAKAGDVTRAENWLTRMTELGRTRRNELQRRH